MNPATLFDELALYDGLDCRGVLDRLQLLKVHKSKDKPGLLLLEVQDRESGQVGFLKIVFRVGVQDSTLIPKDWQDMLWQMHRLVPQFVYERRVYEAAANPMILSSECGNLVPMLANFNCDIYTLGLWIEQQGNQQNAVGNPAYEDMFMEAMKLGSLAGLQNTEFTALALLTAVPPTLPGQGIILLSDYLDAMYNDFGRMQHIIFQMFYTLHACHARGLMHNDDHALNWLVGTLELHPGPASPDAVAYYVLDEHTAFQVNVGAMVFLFDWDNAYMSSLGNNPFLTEGMCATTGECNAVRPERDTYYTLCLLWGVLFGTDSDCNSLASPGCQGTFMARLWCQLRGLFCRLFGAGCGNSIPVEQDSAAWPNTLKYIAKRKCAAQDTQIRRMADVNLKGVPTGLNGGAACRLLPSDTDLLRLVPTTGELLRTDMFDDMRVDVSAIPELLRQGARVYAPGDVLSTLPVAD